MAVVGRFRQESVLDTGCKPERGRFKEMEVSDLFEELSASGAFGGRSGRACSGISEEKWTLREHDNCLYGRSGFLPGRAWLV